MPEYREEPHHRQNGIYQKHKSQTYNAMNTDGPHNIEKDHYHLKQSKEAEYIPQDNLQTRNRCDSQALDGA